jgi:hypothetical protein
MHIIHWLLHLIWHIVTLPLRILGEIIKMVILGPIVAIITLIALVLGCLALFAPWTFSFVHIQPPDVGGWINSQLSRISVPDISLPAASTATPAAGPILVTLDVKEDRIVVSWSGGQADAQWYQVLRKAVSEKTWRRIAIVPATPGANGHYEYADAELVHGTTYLYAITEVGPSGEESPPAQSAFQVVAP